MGNTVIMTADKPNRNGRVYTQETAKQAFQKMQQMVCFGRLFIFKDSESLYIDDLSKIVGQVNNVSFKDGKIYIDYHFKGEMEKWEKYMGVYTAGFGELDGDTIINYQFKGLFVDRHS